ncbi:RagB/SusD family nutrient uptake outer membrane protein [Prolixibacteraceae bacterium JC049]|nr:RagB/SusD family nutrient uptake outer membrane protein [Prolixibacteraceae bacterium JC049]
MKISNITIGRTFTLLLLATIGLWSCDEDKILKETPLDFYSTANLYSNATEVEQGVIGLHASINNIYTNGGQWTTMLKGKGTDLSYDGENPAGSYWFTNWPVQIIPTDGKVKYFWELCYRVINRANTVIVSIEATEKSDQMWKNDPNQRELLLAEGKFFRAWAYRILVTMYGDVPLVTEPVAGPKTDFTRAPKTQIYELLEADLDFATKNLPDPGQEAAPGRITKGAAFHMLSEVYLAQEKWDQSISAASAVIDGSFGYALMQERFGTQLGKDDPLLGGGDVYYDLFRYGNQNDPANTEDIWVVQIEPNIDGGGNHQGERMWGPAYYRMGNDPDGKRAIVGDNPDATANIYLSTFSRPVAWNKPTNLVAYTIWQSDWDNDIRNARHNIFRDWRYNNPDSPNWFDKPIDFVNDYAEGQRNVLRDTSQYIFPFYMKAASPGIHFKDPNRSGGGSNHLDVYAMRLSETYLLRAEAYLGKGNKDLAAADINEVRNRAKASPVAAADVNIDYILDERIRELYTEELRLITLMRLGLLYDRTNRFNDNPVANGGKGAGIQPHHNLFPIPQSEIDLNTDGTLEQNPGYN